MVWYLKRPFIGGLVPEETLYGWSGTWGDPLLVVLYLRKPFLVVWYLRRPFINGLVSEETLYWWSGTWGGPKLVVWYLRRPLNGDLVPDEETIYWRSGTWGCPLLVVWYLRTSYNPSADNKTEFRRAETIRRKIDVSAVTRNSSMDIKVNIISVLRRLNTFSVNAYIFCYWIFIYCTFNFARTMPLQWNKESFFTKATAQCIIYFYFILL